MTYADMPKSDETTADRLSARRERLAQIGTRAMHNEQSRIGATAPVGLFRCVAVGVAAMIEASNGKEGE